MPFKRLRNGDPLRIRAKDWNSLGDLLEKNSGNITPERQIASNARTYVSVINKESSTADMGSVWALGKPVISPKENMSEYMEKPLFALKKASAESTGALCVLLHPLNVNEIGAAAVTGLVPVNCNVSDETAVRARPDGNGGLISDDAGQIQLAYVPGTGMQKCYALLGGGGTADRADKGPFDVFLEFRTEQDGENDTGKPVLVCRNSALPPDTTEAGYVYLGNERLLVNAIREPVGKRYVYLDVTATAVNDNGIIRHELSATLVYADYIPHAAIDERRYVLPIAQIYNDGSMWHVADYRGTGNVDILGRWC